MSDPRAADDAPAHILVVDDDARIRALLTRYLARHGHRVTAAQDAAQARRLLTGLAFDLLLVDVMLPGENGLSLTRGLRQTLGAPVLMLTARGDTEARIEGLESGADDYLAKPFEPRELLLRVAALLRRAAAPPSAPAAPQTVTLGPARYDIGRGELWRDGAPVRLTVSEVALMRVLAGRAHEPVSRGDLVGALAGGLAAGEPPASERAVDVQVTRLRRKIEADPREPRYLQTVRGEGYMLTPD